MLAAETVAEAVRARVGVTAFTNHPQPFAESELPAWRVKYEVEVVEAATLDRIVQHDMMIRLEGSARDADDLDVALNAMAATALPLVFAAPVPYGIVPAGEIERSMQNEGEAAVGRIEIPLKALFFTRADAPETIIS